MLHLFVSFIILSILLLCVNFLIPSLTQKKLKWLSFGGALLSACLGLLTYYTYNIWLAILVLVILLSVTVFYLRQKLSAMQFDRVEQTSTDSNEVEVEKSLISLTEETREELAEIVNSEIEKETDVGLSFDDADMNQEAIDEQVATMLEKQENKKHLFNEEVLQGDDFKPLTSSVEIQKVNDELNSTSYIEETLEIEVERDLLQDRSHLEDIREEIDDEEVLLASRKWLIDEIEVENDSLQTDVEQTAISQLDDDFYEKPKEPIELADKINDLSNLNDGNKEQAPKMKKDKKIILEDLNLSDSN